MERVKAAQRALQESMVDGWLLYDFRGSNPILWELLGSRLSSTRRVFLHVPKEGQPTLLVHHVDAGKFASLGVHVQSYQERNGLLEHLRRRLEGARQVAMEYSPSGELPTLSWVDGGTLELVRGLGPEVVSSGELVQAALARLSPQALKKHRSAAEKLGGIVLEAFGYVGQRLRVGVDEMAVAKFIRGRFAEEGLWTDEGPIVAANEHSGDPHYEPTPSTSKPLTRGDWVLIDLWAKEEGGAFADITWVASIGEGPTPQQQEVFDLVAAARDAALDFLSQAYARGQQPQGWELDQVARQVIAAAGYGPSFTHRLGHSLGSVVHGYGANLDDFETHDTRRLVPGLAFTIEPGIYLPTFGVRSEIDVYLGERGPEVTSPIQREPVRIVPP